MSAPRGGYAPVVRSPAGDLVLTIGGDVELASTASGSASATSSVVVTAGRFKTWERWELVDAIIKNFGMELRGESEMSTSELADLAAALWEDRELPSKPIKPSLQQYMEQEVCARLLQHMWIAKMQARRELLDSILYNDSGSAEDRQIAEITYESLQATLPSTDSKLQPTNSPRNAANRSNIASDDIDIDFNEISAPATHSAKVQNIKNFLDSEWIPPEWGKAKAYQHYVQPRLGGVNGTPFDFKTTTTGRHCCLKGCGQQCDMLGEGQVSAFSAYGAGITNYFKFVKWLIWSFFILSLITLPCILVNSYGPGKNVSGLSDLSVTTVGHLAYTEAHNSTNVIIPFCKEAIGAVHENCEMSKTNVGNFYSWIDVFITVILLLGYFWLKVFESVEEKGLDKNTVFASMYAIMVTGFKPSTTPEQITQHFSKILPLYPVVHTQFAYDNEVEIQKCKLRGELLSKKKDLLHGHRYDCTKLRADTQYRGDVKKKINSLRTKLVADLKEIDSEITKLQKELDEIAVAPRTALAAFVLFNDDIASNIILNKYYSTGWIKYHCMDHIFSLDGNNLKICSAPEPSTILWENLMYSMPSRFSRRSVTTFLAIILVAVSAVVTFGANYFQLRYQTRDNTGDNVLCPAGFDQMSRPEQRQYAIDDHKYNDCYCSQLNDLEQQKDSLCKHYFNDRVGSQLFSAFSSFIVICINLCIDYAIRFLAIYEKHHSDDNRNKSIFTRVFLLKYVNTSCVFLINNNHRIISDVFGIKTNGSIEFTASWYSNIGCTIILVQLVDIISVLMNKYYELWYWRGRLKDVEKDPRKALTQDKLNQLHQGPQFLLPYCYAQVMSTFYVCLTFSTGIPILYPIALVNFICVYFADKFLLCNLYCAPARISTIISRQATSLIPYALILHLGMSIWVLSNKQFFGDKFVTTATDATIAGGTGSYLNTDFIQSKIQRQHTFPLFVFLLVVVAIRTIIYAMGKIAYFLSLFCGTCLGNECLLAKYIDSDEQFRTVDETQVCLLEYNEAVRRNRIKSLHTYNILLNPIYKQAFGITWEFAINHNEVSQVRLDTALASRDDEANDIEIADRAQRSVAALTLAAFPQRGSRTLSTGTLNRVNSQRAKQTRLQAIREMVRQKHANATDAPLAIERANSNLRRQQLLLEGTSSIR